MPGFRYCRWCSGRGCIACDAEGKEWAEAAAARAPEWRQPDIRDVRDAVIESELLRASRPGLAVDARGRIDAMAPDEVEEALGPLLDAEYEQQFPDGPEPIFAARAGNPGDLELLEAVFHRDIIEHALAAGGRGMAEILGRAARAREIQAAGDETPNP